MADTLESLEIEVKHSATGADSALSKVIDQIKEMSRAIAAALPGVKEYASAISKIGGKAVAEKQKQATSPLSDEMREIISNASKADVIGEKLFGLRSAMEAAFESGNTQKAFALRGQIIQLESALEKAKGAGESAGKGIKEIGRAAKATEKPLSNFLSSLKRIAFYRFIRSIIKSITQAFSDGLEKAYLFSSRISGEGHRFAKALDDMASVTNQMKGQLGSAFAGLLTAIEPILANIINMVTRVVDALSQFFAAFTGSTYLKAVAAQADFADKTAKGAKAAKEYKNQLLKFDEINRLEDKSSSGSGGKDPMKGYSFTDSPISKQIKAFVDQIKKKIDELKNSLDFTKIKESWDRFKESVKEFAELVGSALLWAWDNVLVPLAHWVVEEAAPATLDLLSAALDFLRTVLEKLQPVFQWAWDNIFVPLAEWTGEVIIDALQGMTDLLNDLTSLLDGNTTFKDFIDDLSPWEEVLLGIAVAVAAVYAALGIYNTVVAISTLLSEGFGAALAFLSANPIVLIIAGIALLVIGIIELIKNWDKVKEKLGETLVELEDWWDGVKRGFDLLWSSILNGLIDLVNSGIMFLNALLGPINDIMSFLGVNVVFEIPLIPGYEGPQFATGGFPPEDGMFFANHGELVGKFDNGRTAVANNEQIIAGIEAGVFRAMSDALAGQNSGNRDIRVYLDGKEIGAASRRYERQMNRATGVALG